MGNICRVFPYFFYFKGEQNEKNLIAIMISVILAEAGYSQYTSVAAKPEMWYQYLYPPSLQRFDSITTLWLD